MEELARRLVQGVGIAKDQQAGAGWLLRAAQLGSAAIGLQCRRDVRARLRRRARFDARPSNGTARPSTPTCRWPSTISRCCCATERARRATARRRSNCCARRPARAWPRRCSPWATSTSAAMPAPKDPATGARLVRHHRRVRAPGQQGRRNAADQDGDAARPGPAAHTDAGRARARPAVGPERIQADRRGAAAAQARRPSPPPAAAAPAPAAAVPPPAVEPDSDPPGWPKAVNDQVRAIQQALVDLKLLRDKPDGAMGPMTRNAIRDFQKSAGLRETGEPTKGSLCALKEALARRDAAGIAPWPPSPMPPPPKVDRPSRARSADDRQRPKPKLDARNLAPQPEPIPRPPSLHRGRRPKTTNPVETPEPAPPPPPAECSPATRPRRHGTDPRAGRLRREGATRQRRRPRVAARPLTPKPERPAKIETMPSIWPEPTPPAPAAASPTPADIAQGA